MLAIAELLVLGWSIFVSSAHIRD